jgi:hypothetical protein
MYDLTNVKPAEVLPVSYRREAVPRILRPSGAGLSGLTWTVDTRSR